MELNTLLLLIVIVSFVLSIISIILSILSIYFKYFYKRKPIIEKPNLIFFTSIESSVESPLDFGMVCPITFINRGSKIITISGLEIIILNGLKRNPYVHSLCVALGDKIEYPDVDKIFLYMKENLIHTFNISNFSCITKMLVFSMQKIELLKVLELENTKELSVILIMRYNFNQTKYFVFKLIFDAEDIVAIREENFTSLWNTVGAELITFHKKNKKISKRCKELYKKLQKESQS